MTRRGKKEREAEADLDRRVHCIVDLDWLRLLYSGLGLHLPVCQEMTASTGALIEYGTRRVPAEFQDTRLIELIASRNALCNAYILLSTAIAMPDASQSLQLLLQENMDSTPVFPVIHMIRTVCPSFFSRIPFHLENMDFPLRMSRCVWSIIRAVPARLPTDQACRLAFHRYVESCLRLVVANCLRYPINLRGGPSSL